MVGLIPVGEVQAAGDVTTGALIGTAGSRSQAAVDARIEGVAADIIADDPTVAAAAAAAVGAQGDTRFAQAGSPVLLLGNHDFAIEPSAGSTAVANNWWNVSGARTWVTVPDGPGGTSTRVVQVTTAGQYFSGRITDLITRSLAGKTVTMRILARAMQNGLAITTPLRILALNAGSTTFKDVRIEPISMEWAWQEVEFDLPAGNHTVTFLIGAHPGDPIRAGRAQFSEIQLFVKGGSVALTAERAAARAGAAVAWEPNHPYGKGERVVTEAGHELRCVTAHTSGPLLTWHLQNWRPVAAPPNEQTLLGKAKVARGGRIGVGDKSVIAIRFDDWHNAFKANVFPMLTERGFPAGLASVSDLEANTWSAGTTPAEVRTWNQNGVEIHSHGMDHLDPTPGGVTGHAGLIDQIVTSKAVIESWGVSCRGWMQPGASSRVSGTTPYGTTFTDWESLETYPAWLMRDTYPVSEMYAWGQFDRRIPHGLFHGANHYTISDGVAYASVMSVLQRAVQRGENLELMIHAGNLGQGSNMTLAELGEVFDWVADRRDEGSVEVLTPSGLFFADRSDVRLDLVWNGSFEDTPSRWDGFSGGRSVQTGGGRTGANFARVADTGMVTQPFTGLQGRVLDGQTFMFEGWARSADGATSRVTLTGGALALDLTRDNIGTDWTPVRHAFTIPPGVDTVTLGIGRASGGTIDWDDVSINPV